MVYCDLRERKVINIYMLLFVTRKQCINWNKLLNCFFNTKMGDKGDVLKEKLS